MMRSQIRMLAVAAAVAAAGVAAPVAVTACGTSGKAAGQASSASAPTGSQATARYPYSYYRSMMGRYFGGGSMMGGGSSYRWMMGPAGYRWMTGGSGAPGWMRGGSSVPGWMRGARFPGFMMGTSADMGRFMGRLWASAPGPRVTRAAAARLGAQVPTGAQVNRAAHTITFTTSAVHLAVVASPAGGPDETFRIAGMTDPKVIVPAGARVSLQLVNADPDTAHGLVVSGGQARYSWMPMMTGRPAFPGSALWFLGNPTAAGMHTGTLTFSARTPGAYRYLCPVPGHARKGMSGPFIVTGTG